MSKSDYTFHVDTELNNFSVLLNAEMIAYFDADHCAITRHQGDDMKYFISSDPVSFPISRDQASYLSKRLNFSVDEFANL